MWTRPSVAASAVLLFALPFTGPGLHAATDADDVGQRLTTVESQLEAATDRERRLAREAAALADEVERLRGQLISVARRAQLREAAVTRLENSLEQLHADEIVARARLAERRDRLADSTAALVSLARLPTAALAFGQGSPAKSVRQALLLRTAVTSLGDDVARGHRQLAALDMLRRTIDAKQKALKSETALLAGERSRLQRLSEAKARLANATAVERQDARLRAAKLAEEARDMRDLLARLESERRQRVEAAKEPPSAEAAPALQASLAPPPAAAATPRSPAFIGQLPAQGRIVQAFGQATPVGAEAKGIRIQTRAAAQVTAPVDGTVVFAGTFRRYGHLLILEHSAGYHILLAGLSRIDSAVGDQVHAGEPVGEMDAPGGAPPTLYVELRHEGRPINPVPWLSALKARING